MTVFNHTIRKMATDRDPLAAFRAELVRRREHLGLTYAEAGRLARITGARWSRIEAGYETKSGMRIPANPRRETLIKMAKAVGWSPEEALKLAGKAGLPPRQADDPRTQLLDLINDLSDARVEALLYVARTMTDPHAEPSSTYYTEVIAAPPELPNPRDTQPANGNGG